MLTVYLVVVHLVGGGALLYLGLALFFARRELADQAETIAGMQADEKVADDYRRRLEQQYDALRKTLSTMGRPITPRGHA